MMDQMSSVIPKLALGTWLLGGSQTPDPDNDDKKDIALIRTAIDSGITLIDTAQNYAAGKCEELVGAAVKTYPRQSYQILTKQKKERLTFDEVVKDCKESMRRLGVGYIDYFLCHAPSPGVDMRVFFKATNKLYEDGLIRNVGVSNFGPRTLATAIETSNIPIALNQVSFSLTDSDILSSGTYDFCVEHDIPIQAYRTLLKINRDEDIMQLLSKISFKLNMSAQQIAIAYLNSYKNMHFTVRCSSKEHWSELKNALQIKLNDNDVESLKKLQCTKHGTANKFLLI